MVRTPCYPRRIFARCALAAALAILALAAFGAVPAFSGEEAPAAAPSVEAVLKDVTARYKETTVCADFFQQAAVARLGVTDEASGRVCFQYPDKMFWHYDKPEEQLVVADGKKIWFFRPLDNQVLEGDMDQVVGAGEGASFFANPEVLEKQFNVSLAKSSRARAMEAEGLIPLLLEPKKPRPEIAQLLLGVDKKTHAIRDMLSVNDTGDITRIRFDNQEFGVTLDPEQFRFTPPKGADVMQMNPENP